MTQPVSTDNISSSAEATDAEGPHLSLIEEALDKQEAADQKVAPRFQSQPGEIDPLRPRATRALVTAPPLAGCGHRAGIILVLGVILSISLGS